MAKSISKRGARAKEVWNDKDLAEVLRILRCLGKLRKNGCWEASLHTFQCFKALESAMQEPFSASSTGKALGSLRLKQQTDIEAVANAILTQHNALVRERSTAGQDWKLYVPLHLQMDESMRRPLRHRIGGVDFRIGSFKSIYTHIKEEGAATSRRAKGVYHKESTIFIEATAKGLTHREAWQQTEPAFLQLYGWLEMTFSFNTLTFHFGYEKPRCAIPFPKLVLCLAENRAIDTITFALPDAAFPKQKMLNRTNLKNRGKAFRLISEDQRGAGVAQIVADALRLYGLALSQPGTSDCFLFLWQMAESMTLGEAHNGKTDVVAKRLLILVRKANLNTDGFLLVMRHFAKLRNELVHRGFRWQICDHDVNLLKHWCERGLLCIVSDLKTLTTTQDLESYFRINASSDTRVSTQKAIKLIDNNAFGE